jgi:hypothetical protein
MSNKKIILNLIYAIIKTLKEYVGGAMRDRTADLLRARQALSQLSYSPSDIISRRW